MKSVSLFLWLFTSIFPLGAPQNSAGMPGGERTALQTSENRTAVFDLLERAEKAAQAEPHSSIRAQFISTIGVLYREAGDQVRAAALLAKARRLIDEPDNPAEGCEGECFGKGFYRASVIIDLALGGQSKLSIELLDHDAAEIRKAQGARWRGRLMAGLATLYAAAGETERAGQILDESVDLAKSEQEGFDRYQAFEEIAVRNAKLGRIENALVAANQMDPHLSGSKAWEAIAEAYVAADRNDDAMRVAQQHPDGDLGVAVTVAIARRHLARGDRSAALKLLVRAQSEIDKKRKKQVRQFASPDILELLVRAGDSERALKLVKRSGSTYAKLSFAPVLAQAGMAKEAEQMLNDAARGFVSSPADNFYAAADSVHLADAYSAAGKTEQARALLGQAEEIIGRLNSKELNSIVMVELVKGYLNLPDMKSAIGTAERIDQDAGSRAEAYLLIATELAGARTYAAKKNMIFSDWLAI
jgi:tetratricopeptide (TPR) repeat protein